MAISAADVMKLRKATGAGMMDCKNALTEAEGDFNRAVEIIRERGKLVASKRSDREASEGAALAKVSSDGKFGAIVVLNCETDFVAKNEGFVALTQSFLDVAIANKPADLDALKALTLDGRT
ncbi:translation elongation factor Ts, partial [Mangrovibacterium sp.]|uniref:translation elongation factor Ts n=1 Tax=Mangrovibacterium sp. TaxID=1961364 RepID=UPI00356AD4A6